MNNKFERRKNIRLPISLNLKVSHMFRQDYEKLEDLSANIIVCNISKDGIGFISKDELPMNYYFNSKIELNDKKFFYAVIKIIRVQLKEDQTYEYGAQFIGLAPFLSHMVEEYGKEILTDTTQEWKKLSYNFEN